MIDIKDWERDFNLEKAGDEPVGEDPFSNLESMLEAAENDFAVDGDLGELKDDEGQDGKE